MNKSLWGLLAVLLLSMSANAQEVSFRLKGLKGELKDNTRIYLDQLPPIEAEQLPRFRKDIQQAVITSLQALGYYEPDIEITADKNKPERVLVRVKPGEPVRIRTLNIALNGEASTDPQFELLLSQLALQENQVFQHDVYEKTKASLLSLGLSRGYFDAQYSLHQVLVHPEDKAADVNLLFDSGPRYRFGELVLDSDRPVARILDPLIDIKPGDPYLASKLSGLSRSLSTTGYFRRVEIQPNVAEADEEHRIPLYVTLRAKANNEVEVGVGFSTDEGPRFSSSWDKPWINSLGHSLQTNLKISEPKQDITVVYKIPRGNPLNHYYTVQGGYQMLDQDDTQSDRVVASVHRFDKDPDGWTRDVFFRSEFESYTQGKQEDESFLLIPGVSYSRTRVKGGLDAYWGDSQVGILELSEPWWGSDTRFVRLFGRTKWLRTVTEGQRVIARAEQGAVWVDDISDLPPSLRFFTGGDMTVRGFSYQSITPVDENGDRLGAKYATALSLEYDYKIAEKWRLATFVDTGTATNDYREDWKVGSGVGVRWQTPVGPVRIDLAFGVSEEEVPMRIHFTLGPEL
ncbi:autotransporter assembly complex family protein [Oceanisphaera sp. IT1-181]|uniref:autotransporter assembly complex protein TamA n=1 Tax=Oceanisphaera sp. IT1-181 TaxID=3081199 RepID=UPI0029C9D8F9|nr:autotransporter assembly complex family protein [Oceanisphaera sp. IT1-181]